MTPTLQPPVLLDPNKYFILFSFRPHMCNVCIFEYNMFTHVTTENRKSIGTSVCPRSLETWRRGNITLTIYLVPFSIYTRGSVNISTESQLLRSKYICCFYHFYKNLRVILYLILSNLVIAFYISQSMLSTVSYLFVINSRLCLQNQHLIQYQVEKEGKKRELRIDEDSFLLLDWTEDYLLYNCISLQISSYSEQTSGWRPSTVVTPSHNTSESVVTM